MPVTQSIIAIHYIENTTARLRLANFGSSQGICTLIIQSTIAPYYLTYNARHILANFGGSQAICLPVMQSVVAMYYRLYDTQGDSPAIFGGPTTVPTYDTIIHCNMLSRIQSQGTHLTFSAARRLYLASNTIITCSLQLFIRSQGVASPSSAARTEGATPPAAEDEVSRKDPLRMH